MLRAVVLILALLASTPSYAEIKTVTIRGIVKVGTSDSGLEGLMPDCGFATNSIVANEVFSICKDNEECEIVGEIDTDGYNDLLSVIEIRKIDTDREPSVRVINDAAYWALSLTDLVYEKKIWVEPLEISDFVSRVENNERWFAFSFLLKGHKKGQSGNYELGKGWVKLVKRGGGWVYYK